MHRTKNRWSHRVALGLAFASVLFAGRASASEPMMDPGTQGSEYVTAGGWSGLVDVETGIPLSAGFPFGDEQFLDEQDVEVIPYLSHGMLTQADADATFAQAQDDPYLTDVNVRPGESLGGPDGGPVTARNALETESSSARIDAEPGYEPADLEPTPQLWPVRDRD